MRRKKIIALRKARGLSQLAVAVSLNKDVSAYNRMECGATRLTEDDLLHLAEMLRCHLSDLVEADVPATSRNNRAL